MPDEPKKPDLEAYHKSIGIELKTVKNRLRNLVTHWLSDGEWKESALRSVLNNHLPQTSSIGQGFIISREKSSSQVDIMILKEGKPTLFKDGNLYIVTPDVPEVLVEVKTQLNGFSQWYDALSKLANNANLCRDVSKNFPWLGLFVYNGTENQTDHILNAVCRVYNETQIYINCISCGDNIFMRYWPKGESETFDHPYQDDQREYWRAYKLDDLAKSYFISNLIDSICNVDRRQTDYSWFAYEDGKGPHRIPGGERSIEDCA